MVEKNALPKREGDTAGKVTRCVPCEKLVMAPCQEACPAGIDVARYLRYITKGLFDEALAVNRERIPLPSVCGYACFNPCESACAMKQFGEPIAIRALKRAAVERGGDIWKKRKKTAPASGKRVAIFGAGPCGLTAAYYLATLGHAVNLFDANPEAGGTLQYAIPRYRLPEDALDRDIQDIFDTGVTFKPNVVLGKDIVVDTLKKDFDAVLIALGASLNRKLEIDGISLQGIMWGLDFLRNVAEGEKVNMMPKVLVVGGGNVAMDVALTAKRLGAQVVDLVCLETREEMPAHEWEVARAEEEGIAIHNSWGPVRIVGRNNEVTGVEFKRCVKVFDQDGVFNPSFAEDATIIMDTDQVIFAIGQAPDRSILQSISVQDKNLMTNKDGIFVAGDFITGPSSIIEAIAQGREAAVAVDRFLGGGGDISEVLAHSEKEVEVPEVRDIGRSRQPIPLLPVQERHRSFTPVEMGYTTEMAITEAKRCLNCDARLFQVTIYTDNCKACGYCAEVCKMGVFTTADNFNKRGVKPIQVQRTEGCVGCLMCFYVCPDFAIEVPEIKLNGGEVRDEKVSGDR